MVFIEIYGGHCIIPKWWKTDKKHRVYDDSSKEKATVIIVMYGWEISQIVSSSAD